MSPCFFGKFCDIINFLFFLRYPDFMVLFICHRLEVSVLIQSHGKIDQQNHHRLFHPQNNRVPKKCQIPTRTLKLNHDGWVDWYLMLIVLHNYDNVTMINFTAPQAKKTKIHCTNTELFLFCNHRTVIKRSGNNKTTLFC